jgi:hypothetical protein
MKWKAISTESPSDLPVATAVLSESGPEKPQIIMHAFSVTKKKRVLAMHINVESTVCLLEGGCGGGYGSWN